MKDSELPNQTLSDDFAPSNWGVFGSEDELGTVNHLTAEAVLRGAATVRQGSRFPLNLPLNLPSAPDQSRPAFKRDSPPYERKSYRINLENDDGLVVNDDCVSFATQGSSQWDAFAHVGLVEEGIDGVFYNGRDLSCIDSCGYARRNGIDKIAEVGIAGRGVLLDIARMVAEGSTDPLPLDYEITPTITAQCIQAQGLRVEPGDIICYRTGWTEQYMHGNERRRSELLAPSDGTVQRVPGLTPDHALMAKEQGWAVVAADNAGVEVLPLRSPSAHVSMLRNLGLLFGELLIFEKLAEACAADSRFEFLFVAVPLWIPGGLGSPANAIAIR